MPHIHEKIDYAADVLIVNEDAVLLRMHDKYNMWLAPGGHVELDEDFAEAAEREAKEETGLDVTLLGQEQYTHNSGERDILVPQFINRHPINETHEHISCVYFATSDTRELSPAEGEKQDGFKWFTEEELHNPEYGVPVRIQLHAASALHAVRDSKKKPDLTF